MKSTTLLLLLLGLTSLIVLSSAFTADDDLTSLMELESLLSRGSPRSTLKTTLKGKPRPLPKSQFGIPSESDERCVMCMYFVQRIQANLFAKLSGDIPTQTSLSSPFGGEPKDAPPNRQASDAVVGAKDGPFAGAVTKPNSAQAVQQIANVRKVNSQIRNKPGGRGIVRLIAEDTLTALCSVDHMPSLFAQHCESLQDHGSFNSLRKGIFFNLPTSDVCISSQLCNSESYLADHTSVHSSEISSILNGQRGQAGFKGGAKERPRL